MAAIEPPTLAPPRGPAAPSGTPHPYRLSVAQYERMAELGILRARDRVFLWKGQLVEKMTKHPPHSVALTRLNTLLIRLLAQGGWHVRQEQPIRLNDDSMPEPDLVTARGEIGDYLVRHPAPADIALLIEVADTSLAGDRGEGLREYARAAIPIYWIVDIPQRGIEVYTNPTGPADAPTYRALRTYGPEEVAPVVLDGREVGRIAVRDVLP